MFNTEDKYARDQILQMATVINEYVEGASKLAIQQQARIAELEKQIAELKRVPLPPAICDSGNLYSFRSYSY